MCLRLYIHHLKLHPNSHKYQTIITKELFDQVQEIKAGFCKKPFKYAEKPYFYRGMLRCSDCGLAITPEEHRGHVYYHCTQYRGKHGGKWITEEDITEQIGSVFKKMQISHEVIAKIVETLTNKVRLTGGAQKILLLKKCKTL